MFQSPGHQLDGGTNKLVFVDSDASLEQFSALRDALHGKHGGPLEDLARITGEWLGVEQADVAFEVDEGEGRIAVTGKLRTVIDQRRGPDGTPTTLRDAFFTTVPGSTSWVAKSQELTVVIPGARPPVRVRGPQRDPVRLQLRDMSRWPFATST